ncbi:MAG: hypothetical protein NWE93_10920 [Candidatus Bathyarchaeota archaeon]|nr:hypothetical protein [Candidatus Bathyarchaeota archaeon]
MTKRNLKSANATVIMLVAFLLLSCFASVSQPAQAQSENVTTQPRGSAAVIADLVGNVGGNAGWNSTLQTIYDGLALGQTTVSQLQEAVDSINVTSASSAEAVFYWYFQLSKLGVGINSTTIKAALDAMPMLPSVGGLPNNYQRSGTASFLINNRFNLYAYQWAAQLDYQTAKWNLTQAYSVFNSTVSSYGKPLLCVGSDGKGWGIDYGPRYYDECAQTIDMYLTFYLMGIPDGAKQAQYWWNWENQNLWTTTTWQSYYKYALKNSEFECEAGSFDMLIWKIYAYNQATANVTNLFTDMETRALSQNWSSPQWADYVVVHSSNNRQQRLENTIVSWAAIMGLYGSMNSTMQGQVQMLLNGTATDEPAWSLTLKSKLYDNATGMFKMRSDWAGPANEATADAAVLLMLLSTVPVTGSLAVPVQDCMYQDLNSIIDGALFSMDLNNRTVSINVADPGTFLSMFGTNIFQYSIESPGLWQLSFDSDWNSLTAITPLSPLPSTRLYLGESNCTQIYATCDNNCSISPAGFVNVKKGEDFTFTYSGSGCEISTVLVDNEPVVVTGSYTFLNLTEPHTIAVLSSDRSSPIVPPTPTPTANPPTLKPAQTTIKPTPKPTITASPTPTPTPTPTPNATIQPTPTASTAESTQDWTINPLVVVIAAAAFLAASLAVTVWALGKRTKK